MIRRLTWIAARPPPLIAVMRRSPKVIDRAGLTAESGFEILCGPRCVKSNKLAATAIPPAKPSNGDLGHTLAESSASCGPAKSPINMNAVSQVIHRACSIRPTTIMLAVNIVIGMTAADAIPAIARRTYNPAREVRPIGASASARTKSAITRICR